MQATVPESIRFLLSEFSRHDLLWLDEVKSSFSHHTGVPLRVPGAVDRGDVICEGLSLLDAELTPFLPELAVYLDEKGRGLLAADFMSRAGDPAVPYFMQALDSTNALAVYNARYGMVCLASKTDSILPTFQTWLRHTNADMRKTAVWALGNSRARTHWIVPALVAALSDSNRWVQTEAIHSLERRGQSAQPDLPALLRLMTNPSGGLAMAASNAVFAIDPTALKPPPR